MSAIAEFLVTRFDGKVAHGPRKKPLDFGGNPDHVTSGYARVRVTVRHRHAPTGGRVLITRHLFNSNNFATSAASVKACALLSVVLVKHPFPSVVLRTVKQEAACDSH